LLDTDRRVGLLSYLRSLYNSYSRTLSVVEKLKEYKIPELHYEIMVEDVFDALKAQ